MIRSTRRPTLLRLTLLRLTAALSLSTGLCVPALAQSERNGRLLPPSAAPAIVAPAVATAPPVAVAEPPEAVTAPAVTMAAPAVDVTAPEGPPADGATAPVATAPAVIAPPARPPVPTVTTGPAVLPGAAANTYASPPAPAGTARAPAPPATPAVIAVAPARLRLPLPAVRAAASAPSTEGLSPAAAEPAEAQVEAPQEIEPQSAPELEAEPTGAVLVAEAPAETADGTVADASVIEPVADERGASAVGAVAAAEAAAAVAEAVPPTPEAAVDDMAREAEALRTAAEAERTAVVAAAEPAAPEHGPTSPDGTPPAPTPGAAPEHGPTSPTAPEHGPTAPAGTEASVAAAGGPPVPYEAPHGGAAAAAEAVVATAAVAAEAVVADGAAAAGTPSAEGHGDERRDGVRFIKGAGLPPPATVPPVAASEAAAPAPGGAHADAHPAATDHAADAAPEAAPRVRRRPSTPPIAAPYQLVRTLQAMQDDMAAGSTAALAGQRALLQRMEEEFADADPLVWQDRRNARALVAYTLGGGRPVTLRRLLASETPPDGDEALMRGALAYVEGDEATARRHLAEIDARSLPASLGGQLALAQAALAVGENPKGALQLLDTARLLAPGTLVEEAALRRQIFVASELNDLTRFEMLSGQYLRRFRRSVYAGNFRRRFAAALSRMDFLDDPGQFHRLDDMLAETDAEAQRELYLVVAQAAVNEGKTALAATAAERALASAPAGSMDEARGRLYRGAAMAVSRDGLDAAMSDLRKVDKRDLPRTDAALLQAASETAVLIQTAAAAAEDGPDQPVEAAPDDEKPSPTVTRARDAIAAIDTLLEQAR